MKILVTGSGGLVGSALVDKLRSEGHPTTRLVRQPAQPRTVDAIPWNPAAGKMDASGLEGFDSVIHLAGENIAQGRWTHAKKARIRQSRVDGTTLLAASLAQLKQPPENFICASATGYYGNRNTETLTEESAPGTGFLPEICRDWEEAAKPAVDAGIRVVHLRFGIILSRRGGALVKMIPVFKLALGGRIGTGEQFWPWLTLDDAVGITCFTMRHRELRGPINAVAPQAVTNAEFTAALGRALHRPTFFPVPAIIARLALGEMAEAALLASARATSAKLLSAGYPFVHPDLEPALRELVR